MQHTSKRSSLFLLELIIAIAFFSIAAAVCVQFFVKSHTLENQSTELNHAVHLATTTAEAFRHSTLSSEEIHYDKNWNKCVDSDAVYTLIIDVDSSKSPLEAYIKVTTNNSTIYELKVLKNANMEVDE